MQLWEITGEAEKRWPELTSSFWLWNSSQRHSGSTKAPHQECWGCCFEPENPREIPPAMAVGPGAPWGAPISIVLECFGRSMAAATHHVSPRAQCQPHAPSKPRWGPPPTMGALGGDAWGALQCSPALRAEHRHPFPCPSLMEAVGRKTPAGSAPRVGGGSHHHPGPHHLQPHRATPAPSSTAGTPTPPKPHGNTHGANPL